MCSVESMKTLSLFLHSLMSLMLISWSAIEFCDSATVIYDTEF